MLEADGSMRIVEYTSDKDVGFRAIVKKIPFYLDKSRRPVETFPKQIKSKIHYSDLSENQESPFYNHQEAPAHKHEPLDHKQEIPLYKQEPLTYKQEIPIYKQEPLAYKHDVPVYKSETPIYKPETPVYKLETPVYKQETPVYKPETPVYKSESPTYKLETPFYKQPQGKYVSEMSDNQYTRNYVQKEKHHKQYHNTVKSSTPLEIYRQLIPALRWFPIDK